MSTSTELHFFEQAENILVNGEVSDHPANQNRTNDSPSHLVIFSVNF
jgi:hypothetical protein